MLGNSRAWVPHLSYCHTKWILFSLCQQSWNGVELDQNYNNDIETLKERKKIVMCIKLYQLQREEICYFLVWFSVLHCSCFMPVRLDTIGVILLFQNCICQKLEKSRFNAALTQRHKHLCNISLILLLLLLLLS